ncbi:LysR family transcriptional regulator [Marinomonas dokdonensis]|uniref:LysR family transcriptional regulator n=1 Tax=Marinomonas dokdonensis TaxID=328224 RepID=UPI004055697C
MNTIKLAPLLLIFVEVAKKRSFTAAAKKLNMSKSAISQQIKRLEDATGHQLLIRNTRGVQLTSAGEALLGRSELLSEQLSMTLMELDGEKEQPSGSLRVSVPPFVEKGVLAPTLRQLCLEFPKLIPEVIVTEKWQDLIEQNLDAAIFGGDLKDCDYRALSIGKVSEVFCATPRYLQQYGEVQSLEQLSQHKFIATAWHREKMQLFDNQHENEQRISLTHSAKINSLNSVLEMVLNDMGIALLPEFDAQPHLNNNRLIRVLPELRGRAWHFYLLHQYKGEKPVHVTRFYQLYCHYFAKACLPA